MGRQPAPLHESRARAVGALREPRTKCTVSAPRKFPVFPQVAGRSRSMRIRAWPEAPGRFPSHRRLGGAWLLACGLAVSTLAAGRASQPVLAITHVTVVDVVGGGLLRDRTVVI